MSLNTRIKTIDLFNSKQTFEFNQSGKLPIKFGCYFTDDENHISGNNYGGLIVALTSSAFGGLTGPRYASIIIYYSELN